MSERRPILVTGPSGNVGREVVRALVARGLPVRAAGASPGPAAVPSVPFDFRDRSTWDAAAAGCEALFLLRPPAIADVARTLNPFVDVARALGVRHVVFLSVAGAARNRFVPHRAVEDHLRRRGEHHTNLRPGFFAQNLQDAYRRDLVEDGRIYVPAGRRRKVNFVDVRDVAEVAALVLADPAPWRGASLTLEGPGPVSWDEVAAHLARVLGRPIRYEAASIPGYVRHLRRRGLPAAQVAVQTVLHVLLRFGSGESSDGTLARVLGRPPRAIETYIRDHAETWRAVPAGVRP